MPDTRLRSADTNGMLMVVTVSLLHLELGLTRAALMPTVSTRS